MEVSAAGTLFLSEWRAWIAPLTRTGSEFASKAISIRSRQSGTLR